MVTQHYKLLNRRKTDGEIFNVCYLVDIPDTTVATIRAARPLQSLVDKQSWKVEYAQEYFDP